MNSPDQMPSVDKVAASLKRLKEEAEQRKDEQQIRKLGSKVFCRLAPLYEVTPAEVRSAYACDPYGDETRNLFCGESLEHLFINTDVLKMSDFLSQKTQRFRKTALWSSFSERVMKGGSVNEIAYVFRIGAWLWVLTNMSLRCEQPGVPYIHIPVGRDDLTINILPFKLFVAGVLGFKYELDISASDR